MSEETSNETGATGGGTGSTSDAGGAASTAVVTCGDGVLDPGEACDDGNLAEGDGCRPGCTLDPGTALPPVWLSDWPARALAVADGVLVVGGYQRLELAPLSPDGPAPWVLSLPGRSIELVALTRGGDIITVDAADLTHEIRLQRTAPTGAALWSRALPGARNPIELAVTPNDEIVLLTGYTSDGNALIVFDVTGAPQSIRVAETAPVSELLSDVALDPDGRLYVLSKRRDPNSDTPGHFRIEAFTPQGALLWQSDHMLTGYTRGSTLVFTRTGTLLVVATEFVGDQEAAMIAEFDTSGALQWQRHETSMYPDAGRSTLQAVPAPGGGAIARYSFAGDHDGWDAIVRYDAAGALLYALKPAAYYINHDLAIGPDDLLYRLEGSDNEPVRSYRVVPHIP